MKKNLYAYITFVLLTTAGCSDYLEHLPDQRAELNTPAKVAELTASAYPRANYITFLEAMSDNAEDKALSGSDIINRSPWFFEDVPDRNEDTPDFYWFSAYTAIASANHVLEVIGNAPDQKPYNASKGEALVARAYAHFMLVTLFSRVYDPVTASQDPGIPYVTETEKEVVKKYERKTVAYVYEQIEKDLTEGLPLIDNNSYKEGAGKYHFTTAAAHAFATRFYLFKQDYRKVVDHANQTFPDGDILSNLRPLNSAAYRAQEPLVKLAEYTKADASANLLLVEAPSLWGRRLRNYRYGFSSHLLEKMVWDNNVTGGLWAYMFYGDDASVFTPKFREHFVKQDPNADIGTPYNIIPLFTAEEVLFNRAEANAMLGNYDEALKDLNDFASTRIIINDSNAPYYDPAKHTITRPRLLTFYKTQDVEAALVTAILDFKRVEFIFEGLRWFDILRHHIPVVHTPDNRKNIITLGPNDPRRVLQIPQEAQMSGIELNPR
ncbi:RagB/SusD family nutrient uptake outer membrane protein [Fulvivirgaceae bacterium PWU4]|uniref:RagB/SusD family nutrient uptake outer membrane protein n=1 Tax=Chryseosolibacter histidini TaxID=2782349 RepID=A0AAP2DI52_9BACT|nr:RagB/SusD family nutrient uptake outer membrane protein [Chryseosolibacter histidini]MBT1695642.1 RagB/SusD family nutrient uptake outer membrane protein [Chryseosolibacter histidini]